MNIQDNHHIVPLQFTVVEALRCINALAPEPLVLFVLDEDGKMVGTLTDGDVRRALINGVKVEDSIEKVMHRNFNYMHKLEGDIVGELHRQRELNMKLVPILDEENHIVEIINLEQYRTRLPLDAVLMAGGKGVRLRPLTETTPKPLLKVGDKAIIDYNVDQLIHCGVNHISVTVNYLSEQIIEHYHKPRGGVQIQCILEPMFLGTIGAVQFVQKFYNDVILVMNSDLFTNIDFEDFYLHFIENHADMSVAAVPYTVSVPYGIFDVDGRNIKSVLEKPVYNYFANAGIYMIRRSILEKIPQNEFFNATDLINKLVEEGKKVIRYPLTGLWIDIGSKEEYAKAQDMVKHMQL